MNYPDEFKKKVIENFDEAALNDEKRRVLDEEDKRIIRFARNYLISALDSGDEKYGEVLKRKSEEQFSADDIIHAYQDKSYFDQLYQKALRSLKAKQLYLEWKKLYNDYLSDCLKSTDDTSKTK